MHQEGLAEGTEQPTEKTSKHNRLETSQQAINRPQG